MELAMTILLFSIGVVLVVEGGNLFVDAASWIAETSGIPKLIIGATIVSIATTMPEMLVSVMAAMQGKVDMSIGNAVGSVTANIGLIMALALVCMPGAIRRRDYLVKSVLMLLAALIVMVCGFLGAVQPTVSLVLLVIFLLFLWDNIAEVRKTREPKHQESERRSRPGRKILAINIAKFLAGAVGIVLGAQLLVDNGSILARLAGVSERIVGVTLVAVGTSLPELITTIAAIVKRQSALSVGNILGANILDLTLIMPLSALISGQALPISPLSAQIDLPACLLVGLIAVVPAMVHSRFSRWQGCVLLIVYGGYVILTCMAV